MALDTGILLLVGTTLLLLGGVAKVQATSSARTPTNFNLTSSARPNDLYHSASRCLVSLQSWGDAVEFYSYNTTYSTITLTVAATSDVTTSTRYSSFYTLCDGIPRAILDGGSTLIPVTVFAQNASTFTETVATIPTSPPSAALSGSPTCSLDSQACRVLWSSWNSAYSGYNGSTATTVLSTLTNGPIYPDPGQASVCPPQPGDNPGQLGPCCALWVSRVQLYYWPVSTVNGDLCKGNGSTVPATPTGSGPNTYDLGTTVLTSPTVYLSITMWFQNTGDPCSQTRTEPPHNITTLVPFSSTDISSLCVINKDQSTYSFNYADLNSPVPWSAYACQRSCWNALGSNTHVCNPMTAEFLPYLAIPSPLYSDYAFNQGCAVQPLDNYWFDPPIALTQASRAAGPATAPVAVTTAAETSTSNSPPSVTSVSSPPNAEPAVSPTPSTPTATYAQTSTAATVQSASSASVGVGSTTSESVQPTGGDSAQTSSSPAYAPSSKSSTSSVDIGGIIASVLDPYTSRSTSTQQPASTQSTDGVSGDPTAQSGAVVTVGGSVATITAVPSGGVILGGQTVAQGQSLVVNNEPVTVSSAGVVVAGSTIGFSPLPSEQAQSGAVVGLGGSESLTISAAGGTAVIGDSTVVPGQVVTVSGETVSDASTALVVDGTTRPLSLLQPSTTSGAVFTDPSGNAYTAVESAGSVIVSGNTIDPGTATIIDGVTTQDQSTALVVDGSTMPFSALPSSIVSGGSVVTDGTISPPTGGAGSTASVTGQTDSAGGTAVPGESGSNTGPVSTSPVTSHSTTAAATALVAGAATLIPLGGQLGVAMSFLAFLAAPAVL